MVDQNCAYCVEGGISVQGAESSWKMYRST